MKKSLLVLLVVFALVQWWRQDPVVDVPGSDLEFGYMVEYTPGASKNARLPMLVALHGNGDNAKHFHETALDALATPARVVLLKGPISYGSGKAWPWSPEDFEMYGDAFNDAVQQLEKKYPTAGRPVLLGFSGGAMMAYYQAARHGETWSSVIAVSGRLTEQQLGGAVATSTAVVHAYHGKSDSVVPIGGGKSAVRLLQSGGVRAELHEFDGGHLGIFTEMKVEITRAVERELEAAAASW
ncbi:hypothetical protein DRQ53_05390 [bacterium]|nr:MAG: hypothetical protein DRQ53_05390 [bacterium]